jgi:deoxyadenosine/deoxycytidine kinase
MVILVIGPPLSGKTTLCKKLATHLDASYYTEEQVRKEFLDWDMSPQGKWRLGLRFALLSKTDAVVIIESSVLPDNFTPDKIVFMDTIENSMKVPSKALVIHPNQWWRTTWTDYWARSIF